MFEELCAPRGDGGILDTTLQRGRAGADEPRGTGRISQGFALRDEQIRRNKESLLWAGKSGSNSLDSA